MPTSSPRDWPPLTDYCAIFDNSSTDPILVYERIRDKETIIQPAIYRQIASQAGGMP
jgi:hypothetical protein